MTLLANIFEDFFLNTLSWWHWAILALVPPAIILLYFLKLKRVPLEVPSTYLWHKSIEDLHVNSIWQRLRRNLLLFLQLLLLLLAMLALLRPSWQGSQLVGSRFIFLIDNSASMQATDVGPSRLDEAKRGLGELIDKMKSGDVAMLISFSDTARVEQAFTADRRKLRRALEEVKPSPRPTNLLEALRVASGLANPGRTSDDPTDFQVADAMPATLYIFSDGRFAPTSFRLGNLEPVFVPVGDPKAYNVGIVAFSVRRHEIKTDMLQVFGRVQNFGQEDADVSLELFLDGELIDADEVAIAKGESQGVAFDVRATDSGTLRLKASTGDDLAVDDEAYAVISPPQRTKVLAISPGNKPLECALQTEALTRVAEVQFEYPEFLKRKPYTTAAEQGTYDLIIYDRCAPEKMPQSNTLLIGAVPPGDDWTVGEKVDVPTIIDVDAAHPLMQFIELSNTNLLEGTPLEPPSGGTTLIDADVGCVAAIAPREGFEDVVFGFKLIDTIDHEGDQVTIPFTEWISDPTFSAFFLNLCTYLGNSGETSDATSVRPGGAVAIKAPVNRTSIRIESPSGKQQDLRGGVSGKFTFTDTGELGPYQVEADGKPLTPFAVNLFSTAESDIATDEKPTLEVGNFTVEGTSTWEPARQEIWKYLLLAGLVVLLLEWYIYNRRVYL